MFRLTRARRRARRERLSINWLMLKDQSKPVIDDVSAGELGTHFFGIKLNCTYWTKNLIVYSCTVFSDLSTQCSFWRRVFGGMLLFFSSTSAARGFERHKAADGRPG